MERKGKREKESICIVYVLCSINNIDTNEWREKERERESLECFDSFGISFSTILFLTLYLTLPGIQGQPFSPPFPCFLPEPNLLSLSLSLLLYFSFFLSSSFSLTLSLCVSHSLSLSAEKICHCVLKLHSSLLTYPRILVLADPKRFHL